MIICLISKDGRILAYNNENEELKGEITRMEREVSTMELQIMEYNLKVMARKSEILEAKRTGEGLEKVGIEMEQKMKKVLEEKQELIVKDTKEGADLKKEIKILTKELEELRSRIGEQQDQFRSIQKDYLSAKILVDKEKVRSLDLVRKIAFVTGEAARRRHGVGRRESG